MARKKDEGVKLPFKWLAEEYEYFEKSSNWFWLVIITSAAVSVVSFILDNLLFGILIFLSGVAIALYGIKKPRVIEFSITSQGIKIENKLFVYSDLDSFWMHYFPPLYKLVSLKSKKTFMPYISIPLGEADPNIVREILLKFMKEKEQEEPFLENIMKRLRF